MTGLADLKSELLARWSHQRSRDNQIEPGFATLQSIGPERPARGGLAIGEGINPLTKKPRIEMRLHSGSPAARRTAEQLVNHAHLQGIEAIFRVFAARPKLPARSGKLPAASLIGGVRRPLHIGASIAHEGGSAGTLGAFVRINGGGLGVLSCSHVLARPIRNRARAGDDIQQPGSPENVLPDNRIGTLTKHFSIFQPSKEDNLDAAIAALSPEVAAAAVGNVVPPCDCVPNTLHGRPLGPPLARDEIEVGMPVVKVGRTSGLTHGVVSLVDVLNFRPELGYRDAYTFGTVVEISCPPGTPEFTSRGDSGSLVYAAGTFRPLGIHFCAVPIEPDGWTSYLMPWWRIVSAFPISFA